MLDTQTPQLEGPACVCAAPPDAIHAGWCLVRPEEERQSFLHAHMEGDAQDCDGSHHWDATYRPELDEDEYDFLHRMVSLTLSPFSDEGTLKVRTERQTDWQGRYVDAPGVPPARVYRWAEPTDEGWRSVETTTCYRHECIR